MAAVAYLDTERQSAADVERFSARGGTLSRQLLRRNGRWANSVIATLTQLADGPVSAENAERELLRSTRRPTWSNGPELRVVDLFSGCGGLSAGVGEAAAAVGYTPSFFAFDMDDAALDVYAKSLPRSRTSNVNLGKALDGHLGDAPTPNETEFRALVARCDILVGGPPCQGHSAANNRTRHMDSRNELYLKVIRAAELLEPEHVIVENVPGAMSDRAGVVDRAIAELERLGYAVSTGVMDASAIGVPQRRKRLVLLASKQTLPDVARAVEIHGVDEPRTVRWALEDLEDVEPQGLLDAPARSAPQTRDRIDVLFEQERFELPNEYRPPCHASGGHSYVSIYGRIRWDEPAQTVTTGFYSMCMGRNVHPSRRRTITAHEAARIQGIPDWFAFDGITKRVELARMIGNAVPPRLGYTAALELLR